MPKEPGCSHIRTHWLDLRWAITSGMAPLLGLGHYPTLNSQHEQKRWGQALNRRNELNGNKSLQRVHDMRNRRIPGMMLRVIKSSGREFLAFLVDLSL